MRLGVPKLLLRLELLKLLLLRLGVLDVARLGVPKELLRLDDVLRLGLLKLLLRLGVLTVLRLEELKLPLRLDDELRLGLLMLLLRLGLLYDELLRLGLDERLIEAPPPRLPPPPWRCANAGVKLSAKPTITIAITFEVFISLLLSCLFSVLFSIAKLIWLS